MAALTGFAAEAQISAYADDGTIAGWTGTIARSWGSDYGVNYYWVGNTPYLDAANKLTLIIHRLTMPADINIKDMYIDQTNGILYFCGTTAKPYQSLEIGEGVLGWLSLYNITSTLSPTNVYWIVIPTVSVLTKLVEYENSVSQPQVAAIGVYHWSVEPYTHTQYSFVDCLDATNASTMASSTYLTKLAPDERYYDVMLTSDFVVCFGYNADPTVNSICYRKKPKDLLYDPMFDDIHYFSGGDDAYSITHTTAMSDNDIITSYLYVDPGNTMHTRLRTIDISTDVMTHSQEYIQPEKIDPTDIVYIPSDKSVVVMHDFTCAGTVNSNFVYIDPKTIVSYLTRVEFKPVELFLSMTMHDSHYYLAGKGPSWFLKDKLISPTGSPDPQCPAIDKLDLLLLDNLNHLSVPYPSVPISDPWPDDNYSDTPTSQYLTNPCVNY